MGAAASTGIEGVKSVDDLKETLGKTSDADLKAALGGMDEAAKAKLRAALEGPKLKLYTHRGVPNPDQITFYATMAGCLDKIEEIDIDVMAGKNREPEFLAKNPSGSVPALELPDGTIIGEVVAICQYLDEKFGPSDAIGKTPAARLATRQCECASPRTHFLRLSHWATAPDGAAHRRGAYRRAHPRLP